MKIVSEEDISLERFKELLQDFNRELPANLHKLEIIQIVIAEKIGKDWKTIIRTMLKITEKKKPRSIFIKLIEGIRAEKKIMGILIGINIKELTIREYEIAIYQLPLGRFIINKDDEIGDLRFIGDIMFADKFDVFAAIHPTDNKYHTAFRYYPKNREIDIQFIFSKYSK